MSSANIARDATAVNSQPGHDSARNKHHCAALLQYFRALPHDLSDKECPSTLELIRDGRFGQRPPNRINNLIHGVFDGRKYDFERISCGRGEYRWRLHEPNRPGHPKHKQQTVLNLSGDERQTGRERPASETRHSRAEQFSREFGLRPSHPWKTAFSEKRLADPDCFTLTPPEPRS